MPRLSEDERAALRERILGFLQRHADSARQGRGGDPYPEWAALVGFADAAVPMVHDHEAIVARIDRLEEVGMSATSTRFRSCSTACTR